MQQKQRRLTSAVIRAATCSSVRSCLERSRASTSRRASAATSREQIWAEGQHNVSFRSWIELMLS